MLQAKLQQHVELHLIRVRRVRSSAQQLQVCVDGTFAVNFSSNDYLGFANHPFVKKASIKAIEQYGVGSGASQMICGYHFLQQEFEQQIAEFLGFDSALVFSSGYLANLGVMTCLGHRHATVFADRDIHASIIDGIRVSNAKLIRYQHLNTDDLQSQLASNSATQKMIVTEGVFSMDGAIAPLQQIANLSKRYQAQFIIDDAHGIGVLGEQGRGAMETAGISEQVVTCLIGTLGKSFGGAGAFVCGDELTIEYLRQFARSAIYSTAVMPAMMASAVAALYLIQKNPEIRMRLQFAIQYFQQQAQRRGLNFLNSNTAIQSILTCDNQRTMQLQNNLLKKGFLVGAIRPPTVAAHQARLRISLTADHQPHQIDALLEGLAECLHG